MRFPGWPDSRDWLNSAAGVGAVFLVLLLMAPSGGLPSRPQFREVKIRTGDDSSLLVLEHEGEAANNRKWAWGTAGDANPSMYFGPATDAGALAGQALEFNRTGLTQRGIYATPGAEGFRSENSGTGRNSALTARGGSPAIGLWADDSAADNQEWDFRLSGTGDLTGRLVDDAHTATTTWLTVNRTGMTVDLIDLAATSVTVNGAPIGGGNIAGESGVDGSGLAPGQSAFVSKQGDTSRASTTTLAEDADLVILDLPAGHYRFRLYLVVTCGDVGCFRFLPELAGGTEDFTATGTRACGSGLIELLRIDEATSGHCASAGVAVYRFEGTSTKAFAGGDFALTWAQDTSDAAATVLESDSWIEVTRLN